MQPKKVFVGLSGGVDSAVSAALLLREGYDVTGVFIKIWQPEFTECTWREDRLDAMRVAASLRIPFREIDLSDEYKDEVVQDMIAAYQSGTTPNPDVLCNEKIKFGHFLRYALAEGADYVATGHYARNEQIDGVYALKRGVDSNKDQSYFLYRLGQHELSHSLFPVGSLQKSEVRRLAEEFGLPNASKHDSQGLCFVGAVSIPEFLSRYIPLSRGAVLDDEGVVVGEHDGAALYTIGQRHGFKTHTPPPYPLYVIAVDTANNTITVSREALAAAATEAALESVHWSADRYEDVPLMAQSRYRETPVPVHAVNDTIHFSEPHVVTPGQSVVLYQGDRCVGGGIARSIHTRA
jgi:tRNA-specific 2-thiouridylase